MTAPLFDCLSCPKFHPVDRKRLDKGGMCRAHPPTAIMVGVHNTPLGQQPITQSYYPAVGKGDYCFEHPMAERMVTRSAMPLLAGARLDSNPHFPPIAGSNGKIDDETPVGEESATHAE